MSEIRLPSFLKGKQVSLVPVNMEHLDLYIKWMNNPDVRKYARNVLPITIEEMKKYFKAMEQGIKTEIHFEIVHNENHKPVGDCSFFRINWVDGVAHIGLSIGEKEYWGQGNATEAIGLMINYGFAELNLHKIYAFIFAPNKASYRTVEKNGFTREAILKKDIHIDGVYEDTYYYSILKEDWLKQRDNKK